MKVVVLSILLIIAALMSVSLGLYQIPFTDIVGYAFGVSELEALAENILINLRLPRTLLSIVAGGSLSIAGLSMQGLFRNPLADPALIGASGGAALGAVIAIVLVPTSFFSALTGFDAFTLGLSHNWIQVLFAFLGALAAIWLTYKLATRNTVTNISTLLLAGIAVQAICSAGFGLLVSLANDQELRDITFWTLGSVAFSNWAEVFLGAVFGLLPAILLLRYSRELNLMQLGENDAFYSGIDIQNVKKRIILLVAISVGCVTALTGIIGFIGIIGPHLTRLIFGNDHRRTLPYSIFLGALVVLLADTASRLIIPPSEIPIGILTTAIGGPFFIVMLLALKKKGVI